jgi:hypothetical protein
MLTEGKYILDGHTPVAEPDLYKWGSWYETANRRADRTQIGDYRISTVFLGLDHQCGDGPPLLFETMIFNKEDRELDEWQDRYSTWEEAEAGHKAAIELVRKRLAELAAPSATV